MHASRCRARAQMAVVADGLSGGAEHGQEHNGESGDQPQPVTPSGRGDAGCQHAHPEPPILGIAKRAFDTPAPRVEINEGLRCRLGQAGRKR